MRLVGAGAVVKRTLRRFLRRSGAPQARSGGIVAPKGRQAMDELARHDQALGFYDDSMVLYLMCDECRGSFIVESTTIVPGRYGVGHISTITGHRPWCSKHERHRAVEERTEEP
jgi:hypothetical protein